MFQYTTFHTHWMGSNRNIYYIYFIIKINIFSIERVIDKYVEVPREIIKEIEVPVYVEKKIPVERTVNVEKIV